MSSQYQTASIPSNSSSQTFTHPQDQNNLSQNNKYDLAQINIDPFRMSPPNHFMDKLQKRIDNYYSNSIGENSFSFTTKA